MYCFVNYKSSLAAGFDVQNIPGRKIKRKNPKSLKTASHYLKMESFFLDNSS